MDGPDGEPALLNLLAEKITPQPVNVDQLVYCPTMDLIAVGTRDDQVHVFRLNGQRVFGAAYGQKSLQVRRLHWKPSGEPCLYVCHQSLSKHGSDLRFLFVTDGSLGQLLAVAWSDNIIRLISAHTGNVVHQLVNRVGPDPQVTILHWASNFTDGRSARAKIERPGSELTLDDVLGQAVQNHAPNTAVDLPRDLALLDIDGTLPKLSVLMSGGKE